MKLLAWLLDLLYPPKCVICGKLLEKQGPVCPRCLDSLPEYDGAAPQVRFTDHCKREHLQQHSRHHRVCSL